MAEIITEITPPPNQESPSPKRKSMLQQMYKPDEDSEDKENRSEHSQLKINWAKQADQPRKSVGQTNSIMQARNSKLAWRRLSRALHMDPDHRTSLEALAGNEENISKTAVLCSKRVTGMGGHGNRFSIADAAMKMMSVHNEIPKMENTFKLAPDALPKLTEIKKVLQLVTTNFLQDESYDVNICRQLAKSIADEVKSRLKASSGLSSSLVLVPERYKIIVNVTIGEHKGRLRGSMRLASRMLSNPKFDTFVECEFMAKNIFCSCMVHLFYQA